MKKFFVRTGNYLGATKRFFNTKLGAINHIKKIIDKKEPWVTDKYILKSFSIIKINTKTLPEYEKIFRVFNGCVPPAKPTLSEQGRRHPKRKKPQL